MQVADLLKLRPGRELYLTYGLTQAGPRVSTLAAHAEPSSRHNSVGLPLAGTTVQLADVGDGSGMKQLLVSSATVMRRRIGVVEGRVQADWASRGVVATGDVFRQDQKGYLYFQGRLSDFIVRDGEKICLAAIRRVAAQLPHVLRAKTHVYGNALRGSEFDLTLVTEPVYGHNHVDYQRELRLLLRRGEYPRRIQTVTEECLTSYK